MDKKKRKKVDSRIETKQADNNEKDEKEVVNFWDAMWGIGVDRSEDVEPENNEDHEEAKNEDEDDEEKEGRNFWFNW